MRVARYGWCQHGGLGRVCATSRRPGCSRRRRKPIEAPADTPKSIFDAGEGAGHIRELIARYKPSVLWNDIGYPAVADLPKLFADYYNAVPEGVINDRFIQAKNINPQEMLEKMAA